MDHVADGCWTMVPKTDRAVRAAGGHRRFVGREGQRPNLTSVTSPSRDPIAGRGVANDHDTVAARVGQKTSIRRECDRAVAPEPCRCVTIDYRLISLTLFPEEPPLESAQVVRRAGFGALAVQQFQGAFQIVFAQCLLGHVHFGRVSIDPRLGEIPL